MKRFITLVLTLVLTLFSTAAEKPNVVVILADDLGVFDLRCYGRTEHQTPHLDKLAKQGMKFTSAYAACPVCSPTRAALLTGQHPARLHLTTFLPGRGDAPSQKVLHPNIQPQLPLEQVTLAERFGSAGYATACIGKWHLGGAGFTPDKQGFQTVFANKANTEPTVTEGGKGEYELTAKAVDFISANASKPFFLYLAHNTPHIPLGAKRELLGKYKDTYHPTYAAMIQCLDECVGQVLSTLDRLKLTEKTIVVFTSDNGGLHVPELKDNAPTYNGRYRAGKGFVYEGGLRVPLIVRYPNVVPADRETDVPFISTDWTPTLLSLCGIPTTDTFDGADLSSVLKGTKVGPSRSLFWHIPHYTNQGSRPAGAIRSDQLKYVEHYDTGVSELYNLGTDPGELYNLTAKLPGVTQNLKQELADWRVQVKAQMPTPNPGFDAAAFKALYEDVDVSNLKIGKTAAETSAPLKAWRQALDAAVKKK